LPANSPIQGVRTTPRPEQPPEVWLPAAATSA